ncbi:MAG TPA: hypothetical protein VJ781_02640 [Pyrinomonadaceae bacterium]|nr:hypothetical protein [Pyrinomonadaceae bacterium]
MNISVSEAMYRKIHESVRNGCHSSVSEYIRSLVRRDGPDTLQLRERSYRRLRKANEFLKPYNE